MNIIKRMMVAIYVRVSTLEQYKEGYSIKEQIERLTKFCEAKGWAVYKVYIDGGYSGANMDRPGLQELIRDVDAGAFDGVLVYKLDRLSRSQKDTLEIIEDILLPANVEFVSMTENLDTSTPFGRAMIGILSVFAQLEREQIKERITLGLEGRAKDGKWTGAGNAPIGYDFVGDSCLKVNEYEAMQVREAFELFIQRTPLLRITKMLNEKGYTHKYGTWKIATVKQVLRRPVYCGLVKYKDEIHDGIHDAIISMDTYEKAQQIFEERNRRNAEYKNSFKYKYPLGGLLFCKHCNAYYGKKKSHRRKDGTVIHKYMCYSYSRPTGFQVKNPDCDNKRWIAEELEHIVFNEVTKLAIDPDYIEKQLEESVENNHSAQVAATLKTRIAEIEQSMSRYSDLYALGSLDMEGIKAKVEPLAKEKERLLEQIESLEAEDEKMDADHAKELAQSFGEALEKDDLDGQRFILQELIKRIELDHDDVHIHWNFV